MSAAELTELLDERSPWDALEIDNLGPSGSAERELALQICRDYQAVFATPQGQFVLRDLVNEFLIHQRSASAGEDSFDHGVRQGQANTVQRILSFISIARSGGQ